MAVSGRVPSDASTTTSVSLQRLRATPRTSHFCDGDS
jgi:hypothetical protein